MDAKELTQGELSRQMGVDRANITRALNGRSGRIPERWQDILDHLELDLVAVPKAGEGEQVAVVDGDVLAVLNSVLTEHGKEWVLKQLQPPEPSEAQEEQSAKAEREFDAFVAEHGKEWVRKQLDAEE